MTIIQLNDILLEKELITVDEHSKLIVKNGEVYDDTGYIVELTESDQVIIHHRGSYPLVFALDSILG